MRENREIPESPTADGAVGRIGKAGGRTPMMHDSGKSDRPVVPTKPSNNAEPSAAERVEGRGLAKGNTDGQNALRTQRRAVGAPSALDRVRQKARQDRNAKFTALLHHVTVDRLRKSFLQLQKKAAPGVDGVTWEQYAANLEDNLEGLYARLHRGAYRAKPSRRVYIPKADGRQRPLGIASLEDKLVQRAVAEVMNAIYEEDFVGFSYGFRPGRGQHQALDALAVGILHKKVNWVLDADIRDFFNAIDHGWLVKFVEHRIADKRVLRLVQKWLAAGVLEKGKWSESAQGTPQGATVSPLLANIYLHYALDLWVQQWRKRHARGDMVIVRWADDFVVGFQYHTDAERFREELRERLQRFSLELHPDKTRLIVFGRFAAKWRKEQGLKGAPEIFNFLGFTHISGETRSGKFLLVRHTMKSRMRATLQALKVALHRRRHQPLPEQGRWLGEVTRGYFAYHAVPTNIHALGRFRTEVVRHWLHALRRRSQRDGMDWHRMNALAQRWLPRPRVMHPWPEVRFAVRTRGKSPVR
jgi:group II intron reverse transcriptase/maturase